MLRWSPLPLEMYIKDRQLLLWTKEVLLLARFSFAFHNFWLIFNAASPLPWCLKRKKIKQFYKIIWNEDLKNISWKHHQELNMIAKYLKSATSAQEIILFWMFFSSTSGLVLWVLRPFLCFLGPWPCKCGQANAQTCRPPPNESV